MNKVVSNWGVRFHPYTRAFILVSLFCFQFNAPSASAQDMHIVPEGLTISEEPFIIQVFDPENNETQVHVLLGSDSIVLGKMPIPIGKNKTTPGTFYGPRPNSYPPTQSGLLLDAASYIYEGKIPADKRSVRFTFFSKGKDTFKDQPSFSIIVDGQIVQDGMAESLLQLTSDKDYKQKLTVSVPAEMFLRVARAKKVQFNLGPKIYKPEKFQRKNMRALADIIER